MGVSIFKKEESGLVAYPYNFYTFPRPIGNKFNRDISLNSDCMGFHEGVGTDLNRWVYKGINYYQYFMLDSIEKMFVDSYDEKKDISDTLSSVDKEAFTNYKALYEEWVKTEKEVGRG